MPREIAVFNNLNGIFVGREIDGVVGGSDKAIINVDRGGFGSGSSRKKAGSVKIEALVEVNAVASGENRNN